MWGVGLYSGVDLFNGTEWNDEQDTPNKVRVYGIQKSPRNS
jgi:hypothetical protein